VVDLEDEVTVEELEMIEDKMEKALPEIDKSVKNDLAKRLKGLVEENEILRIQISSREREIKDLRTELDDLHSSVSYRFGRWVAETKIGGALKSFLRKYFFK